MPKAKTPASPGVPGKVKKKGQGQAIQTAASMSTSTSSPASTAATASSKAPPPAWPPFKPALPVTDLLPEPLEQCPDKVVLLPNFWPKSLCNTFVAFLRGLALETTPGGRPKRNMAARVNDRFQVDDPAFARRLWLGTGLRDALQREDVRALWSVEPVFSSPFLFSRSHQHPQICGITHLDAVMLAFLHFPHAAAAAAARGATSQPWTGRALQRTWVSPSTVSNTCSASASLPTRDSIGPVDEKILADQLHIVPQGW
ncbi:conserved hypothetical protein [Verticillium alfalfae VaMs.102]|uniref:Uncharacterized protein n=1 Tax=Verticillium alfalfae (strain VaMs.102 / ATCC MYA-4576 / FGSC 10136) TaxID=526221 RepID=C9SC77_VERA1|nr:conserved hypothetical protein [Verticillium alfalfae VaMs.102]EEY15961.1 conserved hypothetical protein [Verticillium alfalfae VaMs.102]